MIKDLDIQIIDLETDGGSFTLLKNIDFTNENAKIDMTIQCINKETSVNECAKNIRNKDDFTVKGLNVSYEVVFTNLYLNKTWERNGERKEWEDWWGKEKRWEQNTNRVGIVDEGNIYYLLNINIINLIIKKKQKKKKYIQIFSFFF